MKQQKKVTTRSRKARLRKMSYTVRYKSTCTDFGQAEKEGKLRADPEQKSSRKVDVMLLDNFRKVLTEDKEKLEVWEERR